MKTVVVQLQSMSPMAQGRYHTTPKENDGKESPDVYERRTWRAKMHTTPDGEWVVVPAFALKNCLSDAAQFLGMQIPGKGKQTYTKHFKAGVLVTDAMVLPVRAAEVTPLELFVPSDGVAGSGRRVVRLFPYVREWKGKATIYVVDETITESVLQGHLEAAGKFIGLGSFRVRNNGILGRFEVVKIGTSST